MKKENKLLVVMFFLSSFYLWDVNRIKILNQEIRINDFSNMLHFSKAESSTFKGDWEYHPINESIILCGVYKQRKIVFELTNQKQLNIYESSKNGIMLFDYSQTLKYFIKNGHIRLIEKENEYKILESGFFHVDGKDIFYVSPSFLLSDRNCIKTT